MTKKTSSSELTGSPLVGVSSTYYTSKDDIRFELSLENAERWRDNNLPYIVVDGSPVEDGDTSWVADAYASRDAIVVRSEVNGIATQRQQGVAHAVNHGAAKLVSHEPEKVRMSDFSREIAAALDQYDVLIIGRTALAETTLPPVQRQVERLAGWVLQQTHDLPADALSGGRGFTQLGATVLTEYPAAEKGLNNWTYLYTVPIEARTRGMPIGGISVDLLHPQKMTEEETGDSIFDRKRYEQFLLQLDYMLGRNDVDPSAQLIAEAVSNALNGLAEGWSNTDFHDQLARLESRLRAFGYEQRSS